MGNLFHAGAYNAVVIPCTKRRVWLMRLIRKNDWKTETPKFSTKTFELLPMFTLPKLFIESSTNVLLYQKSYGIWR